MKPEIYKETIRKIQGKDDDGGDDDEVRDNGNMSLFGRRGGKMRESAGPVKPKEQLEKEGWTQASLTGGKHLERTLEMYKELGVEVYLEEVDPTQCGVCTFCYGDGKEKLYRIYTC